MDSSVANALSECHSKKCGEWFRMIITRRRVYNCFTIFNSPLGTFTSGQTNACGVRHVPYLVWGAA